MVPIAHAAISEEEKKASNEAILKMKQGDYSGIRGLANGGVGTAKAGQSTYAPPEKFTGTHGTEEDRGFNDSHKNTDGSDQSIKTSGTFFKVEMEQKPDSSEAKAYNILQGIYEKPEYDTRNSDYKELGDKITLVDDQSRELLDEYERLSAEAENGTMCRVEIVSEAVVETTIVNTEESCMFSDSPVYWPASCQVTRSLTLPRVAPVANLSLSNAVDSLKTVREGNLSFPRDFALDKKVTFKVESVSNMAASVVMPAGMKDNHYVFVNGNRLSNNGSVSISEFLVEGVNEIKASCDIGPMINSTEAYAPIPNNQGVKRAEFCSTTGDPNKLDGILIRGEIDFSLPAYYQGAYRESKAKDATPSCPTGFYHVGFNDNYDRGWQDASQAVKRCFKQYDEPVCEKLDARVAAAVPPNVAGSDPEKAEFLHWYYKLTGVIFNPGPQGAHGFMWPNLAQARPDNVPLHGFSTSKRFKTVANVAGENRPKDNGIGNRSNAEFVEYYIYGDGSARLRGKYKYFHPRAGTQYSTGEVTDNISCIRQKGQWESAGPCRAPSLFGALAMFDRWENRDMTALYRGTASDKRHALLTSSYAQGCGSPAKNIKIRFSHANAIQKVTESPQKCVSGDNQYARALDGSLHYNLKGKAFPYTDSPIAPSTDTWRCLDYDDNRSHGSIIPTQATLSYVKAGISPIYPTDLSTPNICYKAEAPTYGVDITGAGFCSDGTFSCWDSNLVSHLPDYLMRDELFAKGSNTPVLDRFIGAINPINNAHAALNGANTIGDAVNVNLCVDLEADSSCTYVRQDCDITDPFTGLCRVWDKVYSCSSEVETIVEPAVTKKICETPYPCSSGENDAYCSYQDETTDSFKRTALMLSVAQGAKDDADCLSSDPTTCSMFTGEAQECRSFVSAGLGEALPTGNCCSRPDGAPGPVAYLQMTYALSQTSYVQSMATSIASTITSTGVWKDYVVAPAEYVANVAVQAAEATSKWFSNQAASLGWQTGTEVVADEVATQSLGASISSSANFLMADMASVMGDILGDWIVEDVIRDEVTGEVLARATDFATDAAGEAAFQAAGEQAAQEAGTAAVQSTAVDQGVMQVVGTAFSVVMAVYAAYKITMLVNQMLIACRSDEFEAAFKVGTGSCSRVNKKCTKEDAFGGCQERKEYFCCYSTPLARIIHEGASNTGQNPNMLGYKTDAAKTTFNNDCPGFSFEQFSNLDFDRIDLTEWFNLLVDADKLPGASEESMEKFTNMDNITRSVAKNQKDFDPETTTVPNAQERAQQIMGAGGDAFEEYRHAERESLLMGDKYETLYEDCWYAHGDGESYDGEKGYSIFADGTKKYRTNCLKKEGGAVYPHQKEACSGVMDENGDVVIPQTTFIIGHFGERVDLAVCVTP